VLAIEDAVARISHLQPVQLGPSGSSEESKKQVLIEVLPSVLVLHLKRFLYDVATDGIVKISKSIQFAPQLEIPLGTNSSFIYTMLAKSHNRLWPEIMTPVFGKSAEAVQYKLYGVLYHHGESAASGHYTVDVLHPNRDSGGGEAWLHIDDEVVNPVQLEDVFGSHDNERVDPDDRSAHMLFYCCTGPTQT
jgi:ubiquitin carboxyl-terminal hydrolase 10